MNTASGTKASHRPGPLRVQLFLASAAIGFFLPFFAPISLTDDEGGGNLVMLLVYFASLAMLGANAAWRLSHQGSTTTTVAGAGLAIASFIMVLIYGSLGPDRFAVEEASLAIASVQLAIGLVLIALQVQLPRLRLALPRRCILPLQPAPASHPEPQKPVQPEGLVPHETALGPVRAILDIAAGTELLLGSFFFTLFLVFLPSLWTGFSSDTVPWSAILGMAALGGIELLLLCELRQLHPVAGTLAPSLLLLVTAGSVLLFLSKYPLAAPLSAITASALTLLACRWYLRTRRRLSRASPVNAPTVGPPTATQDRTPEAFPGAAGHPCPVLKPWSPAELWLAFIIVPVVLFAVTALFFLLAGFMSVGIGDEPSLELLEIAILEGELLALWIILLYLVRRRGHPWSIVGLKPFSLRTLLVIPISFPMQRAALTSFNVALLPVLPAVQAYQTSLDPYFEPSGVAIGLAILGTVVMAPVVEEILFRGFFFTGFRSYIGPFGAAVVSSVLFSLAHAFPVFFPFSLNLNPTQALSTFLAGLVWAGMRHESDSVFPSMLAHAAWNFMVGF